MNLSLILQVIGTAYPNVQQYIKHSTRSEHIIDTNRGYSDFSSNRRLSGFDVINKKHIIFCLLQIDNKLIVAQAGGQCDCAFLYDDSINILEFKTNAFSPNNVTKNYNKAQKQITNTIKTFSKKGIDLLSIAADVEAHICFSNSYPRKKANEMSRSLSFANETNGIKLRFDNNKTIS